MIADSALTNLEVIEFQEVVTRVREGQNIEASRCCSSLTTEEIGHTLQGLFPTGSTVDFLLNSTVGNLAFCLRECFF
jgi:hypothetical protein